MDALELATFMHTTAGPDVTGELGWSTPDDESLGQYQELVTDTLYMVEADDASAVEPPVLRAAGRVALWRAVMEHTVAFYDVTPPDGVRMIRQKMHEQARQMYKVARSEARALGVPGLSVPAIVYRSVIDRRVGPAPTVESEFSV